MGEAQGATARRTAIRVVVSWGDGKPVGASRGSSKSRSSSAHRPRPDTAQAQSNSNEALDPNDVAVRLQRDAARRLLKREAMRHEKDEEERNRVGDCPDPFFLYLQSYAWIFFAHSSKIHTAKGAKSN
jgi:hypothetical protein